METVLSSIEKAHFGPHRCEWYGAFYATHARAEGTTNIQPSHETRTKATRPRRFLVSKLHMLAAVQGLTNAFLVKL
jgi:hypothetical protein